MFYNLISDNTISNKVYLHDSIYCQKFITLKAGNLELIVEASFSSKIAEYEIILSENILKQLYLPTDISYQLRWDKDSISIGPVIGLLFEKESKSLTIENLNQFMIYALLYSETHGLIYVFSEESIRINSHTIEGYYFNPNLMNGECPWVKSILPMPGSIYRRVSLPKIMRKELIEKTKNRMFNSYYFDKLEFWNIVSENTFLKEYVPETRTLNTVNDIDIMMKKYECLYIKPIDGTMGTGLVKVNKSSNEYIYQEKFGEPLKYDRRDASDEYIKNIVKHRKYIVQQGIECLKLDNGYMDFRVIMQKDYTKNWQCTGIVACIGKEKGICSNYQGYGYTLTFEEALSRATNIKEKDIFIKRMEVIHICSKLCNLLDSTGENYGDLGIDIALDESLKVWVIEANKRHDHRLPLSNKDLQMYYTVKTNPIKYASALCGFQY